MPGNWNVNKPKNTCTRCESEFASGEACFSALLEGDDEGEAPFVRQDYCAECWKELARGEFFSYWRTVRRDEKRKPKVNTGVVFDFFRKLAESDQADRREMRFVLALYLARRKTLTFQEVTEENGVDVLVFKKAGGNETISVEDPGLDEEQIEVATERLKVLFTEEL